MCKLFFIVASLLCYTISANCQQIVDVTDQTIKIKGTKEEEILFGFAAGDKILFNFEEVNSKEIKEIEILEYPNTSKFSDFKTSKIENKQFNVNKQGVYIFRFKNSSISGRICKIRIQRIPASESTVNFNPSVTWVNKQDTIWNSFTSDVLVGYDTTYIQKTKKELINTEQREELLFSKSQRVHSITNSNGNLTSIYFNLPKNTQEGNKTTRVVAWAYWIGVGEESNIAWQKNAKTIQAIVKKGANYFTSPLGALAIGVITNLFIPKLGEDVYYALVDQYNRDLFSKNQPYRFFDNGKGIASFKKFTDPALCQGAYFLCMSNDNQIQGIDVDVKVIAILETSQFEDKTFTEQVIKPHYEKQLRKEPIIKNASVPITGI